MTSKIKKIIAREGLVIVSLFVAGNLIHEFCNSIKCYSARDTIDVSIIYGYFLYLLIRFIIWAIKTLKGK
ncbi:MAG: hypothetical protein A3I73_00930 [Omnitrophica bacterium RIFCSPLOWO2_02_FULL_45_16]|nr:MAG: hypothetical protein A3C51_04360 [Omnitrophica bacterium RIFCSPHIGHO2_02_FULL_46_20]OGX00769.1 MAG: hypothetical protein A3I73_00930 [Omnitrophica bacterium RIFCSPLOWO2_02_FULL_45_16]